jgi:hypothetical protein
VSQSLLSQPLVTSALLGWLWHDWKLALQVGVVLQILAASTLPVGARTPEDYATGGVIGGRSGAGTCAAADFPVRARRMRHDRRAVRDGWRRSAVCRSSNGSAAPTRVLGRWCERELLDGHPEVLGAAHRAAVVLAFAAGVAYCAVCLGAGFWVLRGAASHESLRLSRAWAVAQPLWLGFGLAQLLNAFVQRRLARAAVFGVALVAAWLLLMVGAP